MLRGRGKARKNLTFLLAEKEVLLTFASRFGRRRKGLMEKRGRKKLRFFIAERESFLTFASASETKAAGLPEEKKKKRKDLAVWLRVPNFATRKRANGSAGIKRRAERRQEKRVALLEVL